MKFTVDHRIDFDNREAFYHFIMHCLGEADRAKCDQVYAAMPDRSTFDVVFSINGIEFDFKKVINLMYKRFEEGIEDRAANLVKERFDEEWVGIMNAADAVSSALKEALKKHFPSAHLED